MVEFGVGVQEEASKALIAASTTPGHHHLQVRRYDSILRYGGSDLLQHSILEKFWVLTTRLYNIS